MVAILLENDSRGKIILDSSGVILAVLVPDRIFVGGIPIDVTEPELQEYFSNLNRNTHISQVKIILDSSGVSKG